MSSNNHLPGFNSPAVGPEDPMAMLSACHERVQRQCRTLNRLSAHVQQHGSDAQAAEAAQAVLRYFEQAAVNHHADEEKDLFPLLLEAVAGSDAVCIQDLTRELVTQHRQLEQRWQTLRPTLTQIAQGHPAALDSAQVQAFEQAYQAHIDIEETELIPMAQRLLSEAQLEALGLSMSRRRGLQ